MAGPALGFHEAEMLEWVRLRVALGQALGGADTRVLDRANIADAAERPATLTACTPTCLDKVAPRFVAQGLATPDGKHRWRLPASTPTAVEASWRLLPGFYDRWEALWDLRTLERRWGTRPFPLDAAVACLAQHDGAVASGPLHRRRRKQAAGPQDARVRALLAEGWLVSEGPAVRLGKLAMDATTLLRLVTGGRFHLAPDTLDHIGRLNPPRRPTGPVRK